MFYIIIKVSCTEISHFHLLIDRMIFIIFWIINQILSDLEVFICPAFWQKKSNMLSLSDDCWGELSLNLKLFKLFLSSFQGYHSSHGIEKDPSPVNSVQSWCFALESSSCYINLRCHKNGLTGEVKLIDDYSWKNDWQ